MRIRDGNLEKILMDLKKNKEKTGGIYETFSKGIPRDVLDIKG